MFCMPVAIRRSDSSVLLASSTPLRTRSTVVVIRALMSRAASAERSASARTSEATTAKPLPASPARAASTPAFSASRFVWKDRPSITAMISAISFDERSMSPIAETVLRTIASLLATSLLALRTMPSADWALVAAAVTDWAISFIAADVSSILAACCSARRARSSAASFISTTPLVIPEALTRTAASEPDRRETAVLKSRSIAA